MCDTETLKNIEARRLKRLDYLQLVVEVDQARSNAVSFNNPAIHNDQFSLSQRRFSANFTED